MKKFEITYKDEIEVESEEDAYEWLLQYLNECVRNGDVSVFNFYEIRGNNES